VPSWILYWAIGAAWFASRRGAAAAEPSLPAEEDGASPRRLAISSLGRTSWVSVDTIEWIEAQGSYSRLHTPQGSHLIRRSLRALSEEFRGDGMLQVHRSAAIRVGRVVAVEPASHGDALARLASGAEVKVSRTHRAALLRALGEEPPAASGPLHAGTC